jgi:TetR/AcrR family transcriptional regulator, cholesterol catabolism regulator
VTRAEIISAAARVFRREGYRGSTMNQIAAEVGLQKASLYHHIQSKEELLIALAETALGESVPAAERITGSDLRPCAKLRAAVIQHVLITAEWTGEISAFTLYAQEINDSAQRKYYVGRRRYYGELMHNFVESAMHAHGNHDDPDLMTLAVLGMCNWMQMWYRKDGELPIQGIAEHFADTALRMIGCPANDNEVTK